MSCHYCPLGSRAGESVASKQDQNITEWDWWGIAGTYWSKEVVSPREELIEDSQLGKRKERNLGGKKLWAERVLFEYIVCNNLPYLQGVCHTLPGDNFRSPPDLLEEVLPHRLSKKLPRLFSVLHSCVARHTSAIQDLVFPSAVWFMCHLHPLDLQCGYLTSVLEREREAPGCNAGTCLYWMHMQKEALLQLHPSSVAPL